MQIRAYILAAALALPAGLSLAAKHSEPAEHSEPVALIGDELREAISGKTVYLNISGFELPIRYAPNGRMRGTMGAVTASFSRGDGSSDSGKWWVEDDQLCQRWVAWMDGKAHCYRLTRLEGDKVQWVRNDGRSGTARIEG